MDHPDAPQSKTNTGSLFGISYADLPLIILEFFWLTAIFSLISNHQFAPPGKISPTLVAASAFVACFVVAFEIKTIVIPSYWFRGLQFLKLGGLSIAPEKGIRRKVALHPGTDEWVRRTVQSYAAWHRSEADARDLTASICNDSDFRELNDQERMIVVSLANRHNSCSLFAIKAVQQERLQDGVNLRIKGNKSLEDIKSLLAYRREIRNAYSAQIAAQDDAERDKFIQSAMGGQIKVNRGQIKMEKASSGQIARDVVMDDLHDSGFKLDENDPYSNLATNLIQEYLVANPLPGRVNVFGCS